MRGAFLNSIGCFSFLRGVHAPETLCRMAKRLGYEAVALTDRDNLCALPEFLRYCREYELRPIIAAEITFGQKSLLLYADGDQGYANLCRVITERHCRQGFNLVESILSDCRGLLAATDNLDILLALFHSMPAFFRIKRPKRLPREIESHRIPCLVLPEMAFADPGDYQLHKLLRAIDLNTTLSRVPAHELMQPDSCLRSWPAVCRQFEAFPEHVKKTEELAEALHSRQDFGTRIFPRIGQTEEEAIRILRTRAEEGAIKRFGGISGPVRQRLDYELEVIGQKGFASYFLMVEDMVRQSPRTCGRGSGAASLVAYCLGITNVDPLRYNLMFERFLNPARNDPPDLDIDLAWDERDHVLEYVFKRYGLRHVAMVATHLTFQPRSALREIGRVLGLSEAEIGRVTRKLPWTFHLKDLPSDPPWPEMIELAKRLIKLPMGMATHCGGIIITPGPIYNLAPVQYSAKGFPIIQWEKDGAEEMGLVKIDLLGNRSLAVIRDAVANLRSQGLPFDEHHRDPTRDGKTLEILAKGKTIGIFYVESPAMRLLQQKTGRGDFEHLVIHSSIIRPAAHAYIKEYIRRLRGEAYTVLHPILQEVLAETYGIMVYQEDVTRVAIALAGFGFEEANQLRKVISRKDTSRRLEDFRQKFFTGALSKGVQRDIIQQVWEMMLSFGGYSFCKPHSASYAQVSFQSAFLKAHYPAAFMAAVLSNYGGFYSTQAYISEAQRLGITVLPPDVNRSGKKFTASGCTIQVGFGQIKGLTEKAQERILLAREKDGPFKNFEDFLVRARLEESDAERIILAGACDYLSPGVNRPQLLWKLRCFYRHRESHRDASSWPDLKPYSRKELLRLEYRMLGFLTSTHPITLAFPQSAPGSIKSCHLKDHINCLVHIHGWRVTSRTVPTIKGETMQFITFEDEADIFETVLFPDVYRQYSRIMGLKSAFLITGKVVEDFGAVVLEVKKVE